MGETSRLDSGRLEDRAERLREIAEPLKVLADTDGWRILRETFDRQRTRYYDDLSRDLMKGAEIDQRKLDYNRGFFDSIEDLLEAPENAEKLFLKAHERLAKRTEDNPKE